MRRTQGIRYLDFEQLRENYNDDDLLNLYLLTNKRMIRKLQNKSNNSSPKFVTELKTDETTNTSTNDLSFISKHKKKCSWDNGNDQFTLNIPKIKVKMANNKRLLHTDHK